MGSAGKVNSINKDSEFCYSSAGKPPSLKDASPKDTPDPITAAFAWLCRQAAYEDNTPSQVPSVIAAAQPDLAVDMKNPPHPMTDKSDFTEQDNYHGAVGRPPDSIEQVVLQKQLPVSPCSADHPNRPAILLQRVWRLWTSPRLRACRYSPHTPAAKKGQPGGTRLPGFELSCREACALHYVLESCRWSDLMRSILQLLERGAVITENTIVPLCCHARRIGEHGMGRSLCELLEFNDLPMSERTYGEVILSLLETATLGDAEAVAQRACNRHIHLGPTVRRALELAGSQTSEQWAARTRLAALGSPPAVAPWESDRVVVTWLRGCSKYVLTPQALVQPLLGPKASRDLPRDPRKRAETVCQFASQVLGLPKAALERLRASVLAHPWGHASAQPLECLAPGPAVGRPPTGVSSWGGAPRIRSHLTKRLMEETVIGVPWTFRCPDSTVFAWHIELAEDDPFPRQISNKWRFMPLDEAVTDILPACPLHLFSHLLIQATKEGRLSTQQRASFPSQGLPPVPRVLVNCEESQTVNRRMTESAWVDSMSCDYLPPQEPGYRHIQYCGAEVLHLGFDASYNFPSCRHLCLCSSLYLLRAGRLSRLSRAGAGLAGRVELLCYVPEAGVGQVLTLGVFSRRRVVSGVTRHSA